MPRDLEGDARTAHRAALEAVEPGRLVRERLKPGENAVVCGGRRIALKPSSQVVIVGAGKAAAAMAAAAEEVLGGSASGGIVLAVEGTERALRRLRCYPCAHPLPDGRSLEGTRQLMAAVSGLSAEDLVVACWSGGGSACLGMPVPGVSPEDVAEAARLLLANHFQVQQVNQVRRVLLAAGDGGVARAAAPARILALVLCDAAMADVASGPTMPGAFTLDATVAGLKNWGVWPRLPEAVRGRLESLLGRDPRAAVDPEMRARVFHASVGDIGTAAHAAVQKLRELGYAAEASERPIQWEARMAGAAMAKELKALPGGGPRAIVAGGETTVAVKGLGRGGRNQEFALAAALELSGTEGLALLCAATDGVDGTSDAAGAVVTGRTCAAEADRAAARQALEENDTHAFFLERPERITTGPTGTNVADLAVALAG